MSGNTICVRCGNVIAGAVWHLNCQHTGSGWNVRCRPHCAACANHHPAPTKGDTE